jgi:hypothetical protein
MEGLLGQTLTVENAFSQPAKHREESLIHRWLAVLFMAMMAVVAIAYLSAAAMPT